MTKTKKSNEPQQDNSNRVLRGGSWSNSALFARVAFSDYDPPGGRRGSIGLRLSRVVWTLQQLSESMINDKD